MGSALHDAPAVVIAAKADGGTVVSVAGVEDGADFVQGNPAPGEFDVGDVALLGDAGDGDQFAARGGNGEELLLGIAGSDQTLKRIDAGGSERDIPARRRGESWGAWGVGGGDPAVMLQREVVGREIILVGDYTEAQLKLLLDAESVGGRDQVGG